MEKNCLNCTHSEIAKEYIQCGLVSDMQVNGRMHCEQWSNTPMVKIYDGQGLSVHIPRNVKELIQM